MWQCRFGRLVWQWKPHGAAADECGRVVYKGAGYLCCNRWLFDGSDAEDIGCYPEGYRITDKQYVGWKDSCIAILTRYGYTVNFRG